jgi:hypothetical protein
LRFAVSVLGHSFGEATAAPFCHDDSRCKAGIDVDGQPFGRAVRSWPTSNRFTIIFRRTARLLIKIRGANHFLFSDDGVLLKSHIVMRTLRMFGMVGIDVPQGNQFSTQRAPLLKSSPANISMTPWSRIIQAQILHGLIKIDLSAENVIAVQYAENAFANGSNLTDASDVAILIDNLAVDYDDYRRGEPSLEPGS